MILSKEQAKDLLWLSKGDKDGGLTFVDDVFITSGRWVEYRQLVVQDEAGNYWAADYERGLTEMQYIEPWEEADNVLFYQVRPTPVSEVHYVRI